MRKTMPASGGFANQILKRAVLAVKRLRAEEQAKRCSREQAKQHGLTVLQVNSVTPAVFKDYVQKMTSFLVYLHSHADLLAPIINSLRLGPQMDLIATDLWLCEYFDMLYFGREHIGYPQKVMAAAKFFNPEMCRHALAADFPRAHRALVGWSSPDSTRLPTPLEALWCIIQRLLLAQQPLAAVAALVQFDAYLRPGELANLLVGSISCVPEHMRHLMAEQWSVAIGSSLVAHPVPGKTGEFDEAVLLSSLSATTWPILRVLEKSLHPANKLWPFTAPEFGDMIVTAAAAAGLGHMNLTPYGSRHGGASYDRFANRRPVAEVKARGRWKTDSTLKRCAKSALYLRQLSALPPEAVFNATSMQAAAPQVFAAIAHDIQYLQHQQNVNDIHHLQHVLKTFSGYHTLVPVPR